MSDGIKALLKKAGDKLGVDVSLKRPYRDAATLFAWKAHEMGIATVLDVGANVGQFAISLRASGYTGNIRSFEPLEQAHRALSAAAARDSRWTVEPRGALGKEAGESTIFVSENSYSSSLLPIADASVDAAPASRTVSEQVITVRPLDEWHIADLRRPIALKLDVQGFEMQVLDGGPAILAETRLVLAEMSLVPLYDGSPTLPDFYARMDREGFRCITITQGFANHVTNELLQVDGVFVRD